MPWCMIYGMAVMRSVIEEKNTRILEVLLSAVTPKGVAGGKDSGRRRGGTDANRDMGDFAILFSMPGLLASRSFQERSASCPC